MPKYYLPFIYALPYNIHIKQNVCITSRRYGDNANSTDCTTYLNGAVCLSICLTGCFYNDNEQAAL